MLGRDRELATVIGLLDEAIEGSSPRLVSDHRSGRDRQEPPAARDDQRGRPSAPIVAVLRGRCLQRRPRHHLLGARRDLARQLCCISLDEPADSAVAKLEQCASPARSQRLASAIADIARNDRGAGHEREHDRLPDNLSRDRPEEVVCDELALVATLF